ncbi:TPA: hemolysin XhlA [Enterobacter roggenkampii]
MVRAIDINTKQPIEERASMPHNPSYSDGNGGGGNMLEPRVAKLESDVSYIKRDIEALRSDVKSIDSRLSNIETGIATMKTTIKATGAVATVVFAFCTYIFGSYVSKILDAINGLVLK